MIKTQSVFQLSAMSVVLMAAFGVAHAEEDIGALTKPDSTVSVGIGSWSNDRPRQGVFDGMRDDGAKALLDADIVKRDDVSGTWMTFSTRNLGLDSRELKGEYLRQGDIGASIEYSRTPRDNPFNFNTGLRGIGSTVQTVTLIVPGAGSNVELGTHRDSTGLKFYKNLAPGLDFNVSFKNEDKKGTRQWGRGGAAEFAVEPIDANTQQWDAVLNYTTEQFQLSGGYSGSRYDNKNALVATTQGATTFYLSLPLDNQAHQLYLDGGFNFTPTTRGTFKLSYGRATQNEHLPTQDVAGLSLAGSPQNLNGRLDTTVMQLGVTSRPIKDLSVLANLRYYDLSDKTPEKRFVQGAGAGTCVTAPPTGATTCTENTPFSFKTVTAKLEVTYRLQGGYSLTGGFENRDQDRSVPVGELATAGALAGLDPQRVVPMRAKLDERTFRVEGRKAMSETLNGSLALLQSRRLGSTYVSAAGGPGGVTSNMINPINIADRDRSKWRFGLDWTPLEKLSVQFAFETAKDEYSHDATRKYGVIDGKATLYSLDGAYTISDDWKITAWYSRNDTTANQYNGRYTSATGALEAEKLAHLKDVGDSLGIGLRGNLTAATKVGADVQWTKTRAAFPLDVTLAAGQTRFGGGSAIDLPSIENKLLKLNVFAEYALQKNVDLRFDVIHERWQSNEWAWTFANGTPFVYATATDGTTVSGSNSKQVSNFVSARYIYKFQ